MRSEFGQTWQTVHIQNPSMDRETAYHPPGHWKNKMPRGRLGPKYESWAAAGTETASRTRNFSDNSHTLQIE